jgi:hypothetical protein
VSIRVHEESVSSDHVRFGGVRSSGASFWEGVSLGRALDGPGTSPPPFLSSLPDCEAREDVSRSDATSRGASVLFSFFCFFVFVFFVALFFFTCWSSELGKTASNSPGTTCGNGMMEGSGTCADEAVAVVVSVLVAVVLVVSVVGFSDGFETPPFFGGCFFFLLFVPFSTAGALEGEGEGLCVR